MAFDPSVSLRIINNERLRRAGWAEHRDLGGAIAVTSDAPLAELNCIEAFNTTEAKLDGLLDIGFALLRAFDAEPAVNVTPLDRPKSLIKHLQRRGLRQIGASQAMVYRGPSIIPVVPEVLVRAIEPDDVREWVNIHAGNEKWARRLSMASTMAEVNDPANTFLLAYIDGEEAGTMHLLVDGATAGIYGVVTLKKHRRRGVATALLSEALRRATDARCDVIGLRTAPGGDAARLFARYGFEVAHEQQIWGTPSA
jgi:GNAT superfamily N-acetyltransferase